MRARQINKISQTYNQRLTCDPANNWFLIVTHSYCYGGGREKKSHLLSEPLGDIKILNVQGLV